MKKFHGIIWAFELDPEAKLTLEKSISDIQNKLLEMDPDRESWSYKQMESDTESHARDKFYRECFFDNFTAENYLSRVEEMS